MPKNQLSGLTPIWLLTLALALGIFLTVMAPIVAGNEPVKLSDWFGFAGSLGGAVVTLIAAVIAWKAVQAQIAQSERAIERARLAEQYAARAMLPLALSSLNEYVQSCIGNLRRLSATSRSFDVPEIPTRTLELLQDCIRHSDRQRAKEIADLIAILQVHNSRLYGTTTGSVSERLFDSIELIALIDRLYDYGRRTEEERDNSVRPGSDELASKARRFDLNEGNFPQLQARIERVRDRERRVAAGRGNI
jgi:hypothetical protein